MKLMKDYDGMEVVMSRGNLSQFELRRKNAVYFYGLLSPKQLGEKINRKISKLTIAFSILLIYSLINR